MRDRSGNASVRASWSATVFGRRSVLLGAALLLALRRGHAAEPAGPARITIDPAVRHQKIDGFGATIRSLIYGPKDYLSAEQRLKVMQALFKDVGLSMGNLHIPNLERNRNDDGDPQHLNRAGIDIAGSRAFKEGVVDPAMKFGPQTFYLEASIDLRDKRGMLWLRDLRQRNYELYLEECAEHVVAGVQLWRDELGFNSAYVMPFNEPLTGNRELAGGSVREVIDIIKRTGARLRREGLGNVRFVVPNEETEQASLDLATAILNDPQARPFVGAIAYHPYPYGSTYTSVPNILRSSGAGRPNAEKIAVRAKLRELARRHNLPLWMTEVSHSEVGGLSFEAVLGRAIHIHDEMVYADAAAYFGMHAMWDSWSHKDHFQRRPWGLLDEGDTIVLIDKEVGRIYITGIGYAIGHYARWLGRGARRVKATSSDGLVLVTAFHDEARRRVTVVLINNHAVGKQVALSISNGSIGGAVTGEESTVAARWKPVTGTAASPAGFERLLPPKSVTTLALDGFELPLAQPKAKPKVAKPKAKPKAAKPKP